MASQAVEKLIAEIKDPSDRVRMKAWVRSGAVGAAAVGALAEVMGTQADREVSRAARNALWRITRDAGRPGAEDQRRAVVKELIGLLADRHAAHVRREVLWMLSEIGGDESVDAVAAVLADKQLCEDARCALERLGGAKSLAALTAALAAAPEELKPNIAQSLRARGVSVPAPACRKLAPTRKTKVKPAK